jgi:hypothetical protein
MNSILVKRSGALLLGLPFPGFFSALANVSFDTFPCIIGVLDESPNHRPEGPRAAHAEESLRTRRLAVRRKRPEIVSSRSNL